jgi:hypothetical protein
MDILHCTSKLIQHARFLVHSLLSLFVYNIVQGINHYKIGVKTRPRACKYEILLKFPCCSVWWFFHFSFGWQCSGIFTTKGGSLVGGVQGCFPINSSPVISSNSCNHSTWKLTVTARESAFFSSTSRVHPTAYSNFVTMPHKLDFTSTWTWIFSRIRKQWWFLSM